MERIQTVGAISKALGISNRMLRYYEQIGLVQSRRVEDYAYRVYDEDAVRRLRQIIILRKLRIPVRQIGEILENSDTARVIEVFESNISGLDEEITALSTVRSILNGFVSELRDKANLRLRLDWFNDSSVFALVDALSFPKNILQEERKMEELNEANERLNRLNDRDVRIVYLPPAAVASAHVIGGCPELETDDMLEKFILQNDLFNVKPDLRHYGFNSPNGSNNGGPADDHGYERWVTIPDDMEVAAPLTKKRFSGGLYAAHGIMLGEWDRWDLLWKWIENSGRFDFNLDSTAGMDGIMEEHLNPLSYFKWRKLPDAQKDPSAMLQLDLLIPVKEKDE